jgi:acyl carrier protein
MTREEIKEKVVRLITEVLKLTPEEVTNLRQESGYRSIRKWTSARHAEIIVALEDEFGLEIEDRAIPGLIDVATITEYLLKKSP